MLDPRRWADLSEEAKDLLLRMLDYDPAKRITSKQARHPPVECSAQFLLRGRDHSVVFVGCLPGATGFALMFPGGCYHCPHAGRLE